ncbi:hypothetical protein BVG79_00708 [Ketogulonicigenium robustum]|uniref:UPF0114 protein BVG79_00708 n=1 Tax=Ketogulonicigenium robustum TaxID=92947 RepID=A0A1W6NY86_9RHOB|nr:TIGR00645 family protein [Ketogulonicigenium robustum]ARO14060.1 hypothetical protein BVG79_00708 [Ketogulonicigenium robustum]
MSSKNGLEQKFERTLFASRWLMAPMYLGLVLALLMIVVIFFRELFYYVPQMFTMEMDKGILAVLSLIDLTLAANLLGIVIFSGYENFISKLDIEEGTERPEWMGTVDFAGLKMKLIASIVAISAIHLLKRFMEIGKPVGDLFDSNELMWLVIIHLVFILSGVMMALMDFINAKVKAASKY